jgi:hypothetical protein
MSSRNLGLFRYEALDPGQIRVLFIWWTMSSHDLVCGIHYTLPGQINYTTVSYVWESASDTEWLRTGTFYSKNTCPQGSEYEYSATDLY